MPIFNIFKYFSENITSVIEEYFRKDANATQYVTLEEIRLRAAKPIILKFSDSEVILRYITSTEDILETLQNICENSIYSYQNQICNGFITVCGGHRVGIVGSVIMQDGKITNINYISSLNFRIARQIKGVSNKILKYILDIENNSIYNTLIVSAPGAGKTTILRDLVRKISSGIDEINFKGITIGLVDERGEIAASYKGVSQNDIGTRTDVLCNVPKYIGMKLLIRSMSPKVIVADEIGSKEDTEAICEAVCSGVKGIFTAHGASLEDILINKSLKELLENHIIERIIILGNNFKKREIEKVYALNKLNSEYVIY